LDRLVRLFENDIPVHADCEFVPGGDLDRRLHVQVSPCDLGAGLGEFLADRASGGLSWRRVCERALAVSLGDFEGSSEEARKNRESDQATIVAVDFVAQASVAVGVEAYHAIEID
jgi:hypothetical protein